MEKLIGITNAILASEKGFRTDNSSIKGRFFDGKFYSGTLTQGVICTTQTELTKWLREKHNIMVIPMLNNMIPGYHPEKDGFDTNWVCSLRYELADGTPCWTYDLDITFDTFEDALESGLFDGLNLLK